MGKHQSEDSELHYHGYADDQEGNDHRVDAHPEEEVEQHHMEPEVHGMAASEAYEPLPCGLGAEGEVAGQEVVANETDHIAGDIGHVLHRPQHQKVVDADVDCRRQASCDDEADKLEELVS